MTRPSFDEYFTYIAKAVAARADCRRAKHGAIIVKDRRIVASGYNGGPSGGASCLAGQCPRGLLSHDEVPSLSSYDDPSSPGFCIAIHAEANALIHASHSDTVGATIYVTGPPCPGCEKLITAAGIERIVYPEEQS